MNPNTLDVAVIILDKAITLSAYPKLSSSPSPAGTRLINVGRIKNGQASYSALFFGSPVTIKSGNWGYPKSYVTEELIQSGDSGGPVYLETSTGGRTITAVNSGGGGGTQVLARVDLAYAKIQQLIATNGGSGAAATPAPPPTTPAPTPVPAPSCTGTAESEPNDTSNQPNALSGTAARCGALSSSSDVDWYSWSASGSGVAYDVSLTTTGNADILMWKWSGTAWSQITNTSPTKIAATSSAAGNYVLAVRGAPQSYSLKLTK